MATKHQGPYTRDLGEGARLRYEFEREHKRILRYSVSLEVLTSSGQWTWIVRYDNWHSEPHRHVMRKDGRERQDPPHIAHSVDFAYDKVLGYARALKEAQADLRNHWEEYRSRFEEGRWPI